MRTRLLTNYSQTSSHYPDLVTHLGSLASRDLLGHTLIPRPASIPGLWPTYPALLLVTWPHTGLWLANDHHLSGPCSSPPSKNRHLLMVGPRWFISPPQGCSQASNWSLWPSLASDWLIWDFERYGTVVCLGSSPHHTHSSPQPHPRRWGSCWFTPQIRLSHWLTN